MQSAIMDYCHLLSFWNKSINLIQKDSLSNIIERHIQDCQQICKMLDKNERIVDVGSGAGFPGIILAINGFHNLTLCEKNVKKATFLRVVKTKLRLNYEIFNGDIHKFIGDSGTMVSRAFGSLTTLCSLMLKTNSTRGVFFKGETHKQEIKEALNHYYFDCEIRESVTNLKSAIIDINNVRRREWAR